MRHPLFRTFFRQMNFANGGACTSSLIHEVYVDSTLPQKNTDQSNPDYPIALETFNRMGANLNAHPLRMTSRSVACAKVHPNILTGVYSLQISDKAIRTLEENGPSSLTHEDYVRAICAHEAVHALENHALLNTYLTAFMGLMAINCSSRVASHFMLQCVIGCVASASTHYCVTQSLEYRADRIAAEKDPKIRQTLISMFSKMEQHEKSRGFFELHPPEHLRRQALETSSSTSMAFS